MGSVKNKLVLGSFYKLISNASVVFLGLVTSVAVNRFFGIKEYGLLVMVFTVTGFFSSFADLGAKVTINRLVPKMHKNREAAQEVSNVLITGMIFLFSGIALFSFIVFFSKEFFASYYRTQNLIPFLKVGALYLAAFCLVDFFISVCQSFQDWLKESILSILYPLFYILLILVFFYSTRLGIISVLYANIISALLTVFLAFFFLKVKVSFKHVAQYSTVSLKRCSKKFVGFGLPLLFPELTGVLINLADKFLLGRYAGAEQLSIYYIAFNLINGLLIFVKIPFVITLPHAAQLTEKAEINRHYKAFFKINMYLALGVSLIAFVLVDWLVKVLYGPGYEKVALAFKLLMLIILIKSAMFTPYIFLLNVFEKVKIINFGTAIFVIAYLLMCIFLIPPYGFIGAIIATLVGFFLYTFGMIIFNRQIRELTPFDTILRVVLLIGILLSVYYFLVFIGWNKTWITLPVFLGGYIGLLFLTKDLDFLFGFLKGAFAKFRYKVFDEPENDISKLNL